MNFPQASGTRFGGFGNSFRQPSAQQPAFGMQATTPSTFGTSGIFGTQPTNTGFGGVNSFANTQPTFGRPFAFGTQATNSNMSTPNFTAGFVGGTSFGAQQPSGANLAIVAQQQALQQKQQAIIEEQTKFQQSIFGCCKFGDERDSILANLNYVQACWGAGKGFYNQTNPPVVYNDQNLMYRFKAVIYSFMYKDSNEDGNVVIHIKKPQSKVCEEETQFITALQNLLAKPNIFFKISGSKALSEDLTVVVLTADDRTTLRRILATDLTAVLVQPQFKPQMDKLGIVSICAKVKPSPEQIKAYLDNAPAGVDPRVWEKAQQDNPDPENMIPIPVLGPNALKSRVDAQKKETQQHSHRLKLIADEVGTLQYKHANINVELQQLRQKHTQLAHRIISAVVRLQISQKQGSPLQPEEKDLNRKMQDLQKQLNSPIHFRGRLSELMAHVRLHKATLDNKKMVKYSVDTSALEQIKDFLTVQQDSIQRLVETVKTTTENVRLMNEDMADLERKGASST